MAKLMLIGSVAQVEITRDRWTGDSTAACAGHSLGHGGQFDGPACDWSETYDDLYDATEYAEDHAEGKR